MIEADFLSEMEQFQLALEKNSSEIISGEQDSDLSGHGMIFKDHKEYTPGDDIRKIDWKAYARTKDFFVKRYDEERSVTVHIILDRSSSMNFGKNNKYEYGAKLGLGMAYMTMKTNDRFKFSVFSETLTDLTSARRNGNLVRMVETLNNMRNTPESRLEDCISEYSKRIENESIVVIISDFLTDLEEIRNSIEMLRGSDIVLVNLLDSEELDPSYSGDTILEDPESDSTIRAYLSRATKSDYKSRLKKHTQQIEQIANMNGAEYRMVSTGEDFFESFIDVWQLVNQ
jgi:uncharacterized protein (DUF58 family)